MIFPYLDVNRGHEVRTLPIVPVRIYGPAGYRNFVALVDSGAEQSVLSLDLINSLGLPTEDATAVDIVGVGGHTSRGYLLEVELRLTNHRWKAVAVFSDVVRSDSPMILGQAGFFEFFNVTFRRRRLLMDIRRAR